jgi:hypothetical protein
MSFQAADQEDSFRALQGDLVHQQADATIDPIWLNVEIAGGSAPQASDRSRVVRERCARYCASKNVCRFEKGYNYSDSKLETVLVEISCNYFVVMSTSAGENEMMHLALTSSRDQSFSS